MDYPDAKLVVHSTDLLPDSRARESKGIVRGNIGFGSVNFVPIFCANCGKPYGYVPQEACTFTCWLCDPCAEKWGPQFNRLAAPDEVFWKKCEEIMIEKYGRILTPMEIAALAEESGSTFSKLIREGK